MNRVALFSIAALSIFAVAEGKGKLATAQKAVEQTAPVAQSAVTLTSARPTSDNGVYLFADALYWHASVGNADWAMNNSNTAVLNPAVYQNHKIDFKWDWGFRVGMGVNMDWDHWESTLGYTWFHTEKPALLAASETGSLAPSDGAIPDTTLVIVGNNWKIHFSMFDWELGRPFFVSKNLALRPHVGIKGGWIHQKIIESGTDLVDTYTTEIDNKFWGVGPSVGVNTNWYLGRVSTHNFSFFGDIAGALMYGHFDVDYKCLSTGSDGFVLSGLDRSLASTMVQSVMGVSWDTAFNRDRCHFGLRVGYEFQYWFRQNQMLKIESTATNGYARASDDLSLQGLTVDVRFDF